MLDKIIVDEERFKKLVGFSRSTFQNEIVDPCYEALLLPRTGVRKRSRKLSVHNRVVRTILVMKNCSVTLLETLYDQHTDAVYKDTWFCAQTLNRCLKTTWLRAADPNNDVEYTGCKGMGFLKDFPNALYAGDCVHVSFQSVNIFFLRDNFFQFFF